MLYHAEPPGPTGERLVPLSALAVTDPAAYARAIARYHGSPDRRRMPDCRVPLLDCRWQDVVFLTPVHPHLIWLAWRRRGVEPPSQRFLAIPARSVAYLPAVVYTPGRATTGDDIDPADVAPFDASTYTEMTDLPARALVLVRGRVAIGDVEVVDWRDAPA